MAIRVKNYLDVPGQFINNGDIVKNVTKRVVIGSDEGAENFYMRVFTIEPGGFSPRHSHEWEHEVFVLEGKGVVVTSQGEISLKTGDTVFVPQDEIHQFKNVSENEEFVFICVIPKWGQ